MKDLHWSDILVWLVVPLVLVLSAFGGWFMAVEWAGELGVTTKLKRAAIAAGCSLYRSDEPRIHLVAIRRGDANLHLVDAGAPIILVLTAAETGHWTITAESGVALRRVVISAAKYQTYDLPPGTVPVEEYFEEISGEQPVGEALRTTEEAEARRAEVKALLGAEPDTMQFRLAGGEILVDCLSSSDFIAPRARKTTKAMRMRNLDGPGKVGEEGLAVAHCCRAGYSTFHAAKSRRKGRWYFEVTLVEVAGTAGVGPFSTVGALSDYDLDDGIIETSSEQFQRTMMDPSRMRDIQPGDAIAIALDLDEWRLYFGHNGDWLNGDPDYGEGGVILDKDKYFPVVASWGDIDGNADEWRVNLGASPFTFEMPEGYRPFDYRAAP